MTTARFGLAVGLAAASVWAAVAFSADRDVTLTTYYPSPRGVYDELRANRVAGLGDGVETFLDTRTGELQVSQINLRDAKTGKLYQLSVQDGKLIIADLEQQKGFVMVDLSQLPGKP
jgi:hypothetical protein